MKKKAYILFMVLVLAFTSFGFTTCQRTIPYAEKTKFEQQIEQLKLDHQKDTVAKVTEISTKKDGVIESKDLQLQTVTNYLYGADKGFSYYETPNRIDYIINNRVKEAQAATGKDPTYAAVVTENTRIAKELDETQTSMEELQKTHDAIVNDNKKIVEETNKKSKEIEDLEAAKLASEEAFQALLNEAQTNLNVLNAKIIELEKERGDNQASIERMKTKLMWACGVAALACLIGTIYSPIGKEILGSLSGGFSLATVGIIYIEGWMVLVGGLIFVLIGIGLLLRKYHISKKTNVSLVNAIQDTKEGPKDFAPLKANLKEWNTVYTKDSEGNIVGKPDKAVNNLIETILTDYGRLPANIETPVSSSRTIL